MPPPIPVKTYVAIVSEAKSRRQSNKHKNVTLTRRSQGIEHCILFHPFLDCISLKVFSWKGSKVLLTSRDWLISIQKETEIQRKQPSCFLCGTHFGSKLTNRERPAEPWILSSWKLWKIRGLYLTAFPPGGKNWSLLRKTKHRLFTLATRSVTFNCLFRNTH